MRVVFTFIFAVFLLAGEAQVATANSSSGSSWVCKTPPIWNGRARGPRVETGSSRDEAYNKAVQDCRYSGYAAVCVSQISCWQ